MIDPMLRVAMPLPDHDFDPTEAAIPWKLIREAGHEVVFATQHGTKPSADPLMVSGEELDPWGRIPGLKKLKVIGLALRARRPAREAYIEMKRDRSFMSPLEYSDLNAVDFDGLVLAGGHGPGMKQYLENAVLQKFVGDFYEAAIGNRATRNRAIGAICHGVVLAARSTSPTTGKSVLHGLKTTALTWRQERLAWRLTKYFARFWDPQYYRTYSEADGDPDGHMSVESEVKRALANDDDFVDVPRGIENYKIKTNNRDRDRSEDARPAWVVRDGNYVSARWPGDAHTFAKTFIEVLESQ